MLAEAGDGSDASSEAPESAPERGKPPGPSGLPAIGNVHQFVRDPLGFYETLADEYAGDVATYRVFGDRVYACTNPDSVEAVLCHGGREVGKGKIWQSLMGELVENGLTVVEGQQWEEHREALNPAFSLRQLRSYGETMTDYAADATRDWTSGRPLCMDDEMRTYTLDVLAKTLFDIDVDGSRRETVARASRAITRRFDLSSLSAFVPLWVPTPSNRRCKRALTDFRSVVDDIIAERTPVEESNGDILSLLLATSDGPEGGLTDGSAGRLTDGSAGRLTDGSAGRLSDGSAGRLSDGSAGRLTDAEIKDELLTFLSAGHETTLLALTYAWFLLANNPACQTRLQEEVDSLEGDPGLDDLSELRYTDAVLSETLRLYPPAALTFREAEDDVEIDGYAVPEGSILVLPQWVVHRDPRWWDDPEEFRPGRWTGDVDRPEYAYFPFGAGPRRCIGMRFAKMEVKLALATIARRWTFDPVTEPPLDLSVRVTLQPDEDVELIPRRR